MRKTMWVGWEMLNAKAWLFKNDMVPDMAASPTYTRCGTTGLRKALVCTGGGGVQHQRAWGGLAVLTETM